MVALVKNKLPQIIDTCKKMKLKSLYLIGSASRENDFTSESDIDFLFSMISDAEGLGVSDYDYFDVKFKLEEITGRKVDLIPDYNIRNKYFLQSILEDKIKIYEA
jgi:uncharacterized protein